MKIPLVDLRTQYDCIKHEIDAAIQEVIATSAFIGGPYVRAFEEAFARFCGVKHCIGEGNGTDAIFITLKSFGIGVGDEVITAANSFIATSEVITMTGAQVVFCDIDPSTYNIDVSQIEAKITPRTKAIIPVHLYGQLADMDPILELARRHGLKIVEDAAQAHGACYKGRRVGGLGDVVASVSIPGKTSAPMVTVAPSSPMRRWHSRSGCLPTTGEWTSTITRLRGSTVGWTACKQPF